MGISYKTYVGPYVRCAVGFKDEIKTKRACLNQTCKRYGKDGHSQHSFCAVCGSPIGDIPYTERTEAVDRWEVSEEIDQRLTDPGGDGYIRWIEENSTHLWIPNIGVPWRDGDLEKGVDFALVDIDAGQVQVETNQFTFFFSDELATFRERYGPDAISVRWGIIQHYY